MKEIILIAIPFFAALGALLWKRNTSRGWFLPLAAVPHSVLSVWMLLDPPEFYRGTWLAFDPLARAILPAVSLLFLACASYGVTYLNTRQERPNRIFVASLLALIGLITLSLQSQHVVLLWVAAEGATLATVPLLHFNSTPRAFEATWKYLLVGGTGIAMSLLGAFLLGYSSLANGGAGDLTFAGLTDIGARLSRPWVLAAWVLWLTGFGTKMGLAPMHTWKPDAYGEAPGMIGAVLAGGMTTVAFVALLRVKAVVASAGMDNVATFTLLALGLFSMFVAALFLLGTPDFKRMLAYSSVEHMGILSVGAAMGPPGLAAALFHVWSIGLTKGALFLSAGNLRRAAGGRTAREVSGMAMIAPVSSKVFVVGLLAVTACPPFGPFFSELAIVRATFLSGHYIAAMLFLCFMLVAFLGMTRLVFAIVDGRPRKAARYDLTLRERLGTTLPAVILLVASMALGLFTPAALKASWAAAVTHLWRVQ